MMCKPEDCCNCTGACLREDPAYNAAEEELNGSRAGSIIILAALTAALAIGWASCARADEYDEAAFRASMNTKDRSNDGKVNCQDHALTAFAHLQSRELPARFTFCQRGGVEHMFLTVPGGAIDNRAPRVISVADVGCDL